MIHVTLRVSDLMDKWLADVTFDWRHIMAIETAIESNNQTRPIITLLHRLFCSKTFTNNDKNDVKIKCIYERFISIFWLSLKYADITYFECDPLRSYFDEWQ